MAVRSPRTRMAINVITIENTEFRHIVSAQQVACVITQHVTGSEAVAALTLINGGLPVP
jgi:hypothetical protein